MDLLTSSEPKNYEPAGGYDSISLAGLQHAKDRLTGQPSSWPSDGEVVSGRAETQARGATGIEAASKVPSRASRGIRQTSHESSAHAARSSSWPTVSRMALNA